MKGRYLLRVLISTLLCGILLLGCLGVVTAEEAGDKKALWGDVDGDGTITSTDARLTLQVYAGKVDESALDTAVADVDGDGDITSTDARLILQYYAGKIDHIDPPEPSPGEIPVDLGGYEFTVADYVDNRFTKESDGSLYANAWAQVVNEVEVLYNCKISRSTLNAAEMFTTIQPEIAAGGKYADLIITPQWQYGYFVAAGTMMDLNTLDVNWDNEWWNQNIRNMATFNGKTYAGGGSFLSDTAHTWLLYYNKAIWNDNGFEDPYKLVDEGRWTQDLFAQYCRTAARDRDDSEILDSYDDLWGVLAADGDFCRAWYMALGGKYFETNPDNSHIQVACNNRRTLDILGQMHNMVQKDKTVCRLPYEGGEAERVAHFVNGGALFYAGTLGASGLQDMKDDWGVMPLPKLDAAQTEYLSGVDHHSPVFGVTNTNYDTREVAIILEALGRHGRILEDVYWPDYEEGYWRNKEEDARMMSEYVVGHGQHDVALIMQNCNAVFSAPMNRMFGTVYGTVPDFESWIIAVEPVIELTIADYFGYQIEP